LKPNVPDDSSAGQRGRIEDAGIERMVLESRSIGFAMMKSRGVQNCDRQTSLAA
jgi:hypothetical protein